MSDPHAPQRICVTVKVPESKKWAGDNPWFVFEGSDAAAVRQQIIDTFGLEADESLTLFDVTVNAQHQAVTLGHAAHALGGTVLNRGPRDASEAGETPAESSGDVWSQVNDGAQAAREDKEPADPILTAIEQCTTIPDLQQVWAENQAAFNDTPAYMDAYKAKGRSLS